MDFTIYESLFNRLASSLYNKGAFSQTKMVTSVPAMSIFKTLQFFRQPLGLMKTLFIEVKVTEAPSFSIRQSDGITVNGRARVRVFTMKAKNKIRAVKKQSNLLSVSATFKVAMEVAITGQSLTFHSNEVLCTILTKTAFRDALLSVLNGFLKSKIEKTISEMQIPLSKEVAFTPGEIDFFDGFMTVRVSLEVADAIMEKLVGKIFKHAIRGQSLTFHSNEVLFTFVTKTAFIDALLSVLNGFLKSKIEKTISEMSKEVAFTPGEIDFCKGSIRVRVSLEVADAIMEKLVEKLVGKVHERLGKVLKRV
ncbi:uncharacterized protein [Labrus bergylta]|uniref:uncharacterized protein isoform X1 n=1 Tax=Labrus bergylta TaxID=56723 RepID=UPI003313B617